MNIAFVGAGRLATNLALALKRGGHNIVRVYSRTQESASELAMRVGAESVTTLDALGDDADAYVVALKDSALPVLLDVLCKGREDKIFLHTSGSVPMSVFEKHLSHYGVLYPLQTFSKERIVDFDDIPMFIEGSDEHTLTVTRVLAESVSSKVAPLSSADRKHIHLAAVFVNNFVNHCYTMASDILAKYDLPFDYLLPLIDETARKVHQMKPQEAQTGPAIRYDENIIRSQSSMLADNPPVREIYDKMSLNIHERTQGDTTQKQ